MVKHPQRQDDDTDGNDDKEPLGRYEHVSARRWRLVGPALRVDSHSALNLRKLCTP